MAKISVTDIGRRVIRIFLSSTFADLNTERTYLAKYVFPRLRYNLKKYNISLMDIDLRWGITEDEAKSGQTLKICLEQIQNTHPFFIGILGNRYGWIPEPEFCKDIPLNKEDKDKSITEIEIRHGVLNSGVETNSAFFIKETDEDFGEEQEKKEKLDTLKTEIRNSSYPVKLFKDEKELGDMIEDTIMGWIKKYYNLNYVTKEELVEATQKQLLDDYLQGYVTTERYEKTIGIIDNQFRIKDGLDVIPVIAPHGVGKRAFSAYASKSFLERGTVSRVVQYYFNDECDASSIDDAINYLIKSIENQFEQHPHNENCKYYYQLPQRYNRLMKAVQLAESDQPWLLTLGGIHLLPKSDFEDWLRFITKLPKGVKVIFTSGHRVEHVPLVKQYFGEFFFSPGGYSTQEKTKIIKNYFEQYGKTLDESYISTIVNSATTPNGYNSFSNMLNLQVVLNELRIFGEFERIGEYIGSIAKDAHNDNNFIHILIDSWSQAYDHKGNKMVETVLSLLSICEYGLDERHILDFLNAPAIKWQQFISIIEPFIYYADGRIFLHEYLRSNFNSYLNNNIKPHRARYIRYMEKCIASEDYLPDFMLLELTETYRYYHFQIMKYKRGGMPDYFVPECYTPDFSFSPDELLSALSAIAENPSWMKWIHANGRQGIIQKILGYLKQNSQPVDFYRREKENAQVWADLLYKAGCYKESLEAYIISDEEDMDLSEKIATYTSIVRLCHKANIKNQIPKYGEKLLELLEQHKVKDPLLKTEIKAIIMSALPKEKWVLNNANKLLENLGIPTQEKIPAMEALITIIRELSGKNYAARLYCDDFAVSIYQCAGLKDEMRLPIASAFYSRAFTYQKLNRKDEALYDYLNAYEIFSSIKGIPDNNVLESAYSSYMAVCLAMDICINLDIWTYLSNTVSCMSLLLYHRSGWQQTAWLMDEALDYMQVAVQIPGMESHANMYKFYREEYEKYKNCIK